jgi:DNA-binding transcriptional MerR regulator
MQLDYWTERGSIPTQGKKQRLYDAAAVETVMLIKQARDLGFDVNAAIAASRDFQARHASTRDQSQLHVAA